VRQNNVKQLLFACSIGIMSLLANTPYRFQMALGRFLGRVGYLFARRRRSIAKANLQLCFPDETPAQRKNTLKHVFQSTGMGAMEVIMAWWMRPQRFQRIPFHLNGAHYLQEALASGNGVIFIGAHFSCLEIIGRFFGQSNDYSIIYKKHRNSHFEQLMVERRHKYLGQLIDNKNFRQVFKNLRAGGLVWYCPDQDFGPEMSVMAPFFNVPTATLNVTGKLARVGRAMVIPVFFNRSGRSKGYEITFHRPLKYIPEDGDDAFTYQYNALLEGHVSDHKSQYHWVHRRFKTRPPGAPKLY